MLGKRGQFYIVAAIIIVLVLYLLAGRENVFREQPKFYEFNKLAGNYLGEVAKIVNNGVYNRLSYDNMLLRIRQFTLDFLGYARSRDANLGLVYVYADPSKTVIENHLPGSSQVTYDSLSAGNTVLFSSDDNSVNGVSLNIGGEEFTHDVPVKLGSFSSSYFSNNVENGPLKIDIGGIIYNVDTSSGNAFEVYVKTEQENTPGNVVVETCQYSGTGAWTNC